MFYRRFLSIHSLHCPYTHTHTVSSTEMWVVKIKLSWSASFLMNCHMKILEDWEHNRYKMMVWCWELEHSIIGTLKSIMCVSLGRAQKILITCWTWMMFFGHGFQLVVNVAHTPQLLMLTVTQQFFNGQERSTIWVYQPLICWLDRVLRRTRLS